MASAKRPPQHRLTPIGTPYLSQSFNISLMNKLNKIDERRQPCQTPFLILKYSDNWPSIPTQVLEDKYKFSIFFFFF